MSPDEVIEAARLGAIKKGYEFNEKQLTYLQASARAGSRTFFLNR